jgi:hypothetical protein
LLAVEIKMQTRHPDNSFLNPTVKTDENSKQALLNPTFLPPPVAEHTTAATLLPDESASLSIPMSAPMDISGNPGFEEYPPKLLSGNGETAEQHQQILNSDEIPAEMGASHVERSFSTSGEISTMTTQHTLSTGSITNVSTPSPSRTARVFDLSSSTTASWTTPGSTHQETSSESADQRSRRCKCTAINSYNTTYNINCVCSKARENFTSEQLAFLRQLYASGVTRTSCHLEIQAAANQLGISYDRVKVTIIYLYICTLNPVGLLVNSYLML